ncbi:MAG: hypothetical protein ACREKN_09170 [Longimicrobiaceae bacterium]
MKTLLLTPTLAFLAIVALAACEERPLEPPSDGPSWLLADLRGAVEEEHEANARFNEGPHHWAGIEMTFGVFSSGAEDALGRWSKFGIVRYGAGRPEPGTYPLLRFDLTNPEATGTLMRFTRQDGDRMRQWTSTSGTLTITASSEERVEGRFEFTAIECGTRECAPDPTTIRVTGSFSALPHDPTAGVPVPGP